MPVTAAHNCVPCGFHPGKEKETTDKYQKHDQRDKTASVEMDDLLCSHEIAVNQKRSRVDAETGDQAQGVQHVREYHLTPLGDENDSRKETRI